MVGKKIRALRKERRWNQGTLASRLHVCRSTISCWETERVDPPLDRSRELALLFDVSADYLLDLPPHDPPVVCETSFTKSCTGAGKPEPGKNR